MNPEDETAQLMLMAVIPDRGYLTIPVKRLTEVSRGELHLELDESTASYKLWLTGPPSDDGA